MIHSDYLDWIMLALFIIFILLLLILIGDSVICYSDIQVVKKLFREFL